MPWVYLNVLESKQGFLQGLSWCTVLEEELRTRPPRSANLCRAGIQLFGLKPFQLDREMWLNSLSLGTGTLGWPRWFQITPPHLTGAIHCNSSCCCFIGGSFSRAKGPESLSHCLDSFFTEVCWWAGEKQGRSKENIEQELTVPTYNVIICFLTWKG